MTKKRATAVIEAGELMNLMTIVTDSVKLLRI
jgi:hypothetical protein